MIQKERLSRLIRPRQTRRIVDGYRAGWSTATRRQSYEIRRLCVDLWRSSAEPGERVGIVKPITIEKHCWNVARTHDRGSHSLDRFIQLDLASALQTNKRLDRWSQRHGQDRKHRQHAQRTCGAHLIRTPFTAQYQRPGMLLPSNRAWRSPNLGDQCAPGRGNFAKANLPGDTKNAQLFRQ